MAEFFIFYCYCFWLSYSPFKKKQKEPWERGGIYKSKIFLVNLCYYYTQHVYFILSGQKHAKVGDGTLTIITRDIYTNSK